VLPLHYAATGIPSDSPDNDLGDDAFVDDVLVARDLVLQFLNSHFSLDVHGTVRSGYRTVRAVCASGADPIYPEAVRADASSAWPRGSVEISFAKTTIRCEALYSGWQAESTSWS